MLASKNEKALRDKVKPFSRNKVLRRRWQTISFHPRTLTGQPSTLVIPTKSKEEMKEFLELLKSFSCELEKKCSRNDSGVEVMGINDDAEDYAEI